MSGQTIVVGNVCIYGVTAEEAELLDVVLVVLAAVTLLLQSFNQIKCASLKWVKMKYIHFL